MNDITSCTVILMLFTILRTTEWFYLMTKLEYILSVYQQYHVILDEILPNQRHRKVIHIPEVH